MQLNQQNVQLISKTNSNSPNSLQQHNKPIVTAPDSPIQTSPNSNSNNYSNNGNNGIVSIIENNNNNNNNNIIQPGANKLVFN